MNVKDPQCEHIPLRGETRALIPVSPWAEQPLTRRTGMRARVTRPGHRAGNEPSALHLPCRGRGKKVPRPRLLGVLTLEAPHQLCRGLVRRAQSYLLASQTDKRTD